METSFQTPTYFCLRHNLLSINYLPIFFLALLLRMGYDGLVKVRGKTVDLRLQAVGLEKDLEDS